MQTLEATAEVDYDVETMAKKKRKPEQPARKRRWTPAKIRALRHDLGLTQEEAAARVAVARISWARWEAGTQFPSPPLELLLDLLAKESKK